MLLLTSCSQQPYIERTLEQYQSRLANVLDTSVPESIATSPFSTKTSVKTSEGPSQTRIESESKIKLNEFYQLPECGIKPLIAERNTTLGKLQTPSQRYIYETRLLNKLVKCRSDDPEQQQLINKLTRLKNQHRRESWQKLLAQSTEIRTALTTGNAHFSKNDNHDFAVQSWLQLKALSPEALLNEQEDKLVSSLEGILKSISDSKTPARLSNTHELLAQRLPEITRFLRQHTDGFQCQNHKEKQQAEYLQNVFNLFFIEEIQPLGSKMNKWYYNLDPVLAELLQNEHYNTQLVSHQTQFSQYQQAIKEHVIFWQQLFKRCNLSPVG